MPLSEIHHVALTVSNLERSTAFYRDILGFHQILDMQNQAMDRILKLRPGTTGRAIMMAQGSSVVGEIELIQFDPPHERQTGPKRAGDVGIFLLSFQLKDEELAAVRERLTQNGIKLFSDIEASPIEHYGTIHTLIFEDPDGNLIECVQFPAPEEVKRNRDARRASLDRQRGKP